MNLLNKTCNKISFLGNRFYKIYILFCLISFVASANLYAQKQPQNFNEYYAKALAEYRSSDYETCINTISNMPKIEKNQACFFILRGDAFYALKHYDKALNDYKDAQKYDKKSGLLQIAKIYSIEKKYAEAIDYLKLYFDTHNKLSLSDIKLDPAFSQLTETREWGKLMSGKHYNTIETELAEAQYLLKSGHISEALSLINVRIKKSKKYADAYIVRGDIFKKNKEYKQALKDYSKAIKLKGKKYSYHLKRANLYMQTGNYEKALSDYAECENLLPNEIKIKLYKAQAEYKAGLYEQAVSDLEIYHKYFKKTAEDFYLKGQISLAQNENLDALNFLNKSIKANPANHNYYKARATAYTRAEMHKRALNDLGMALDLHPDGETYYLRALVRLKTGDTKGACHDKKLAVHYKFYKAIDIIVNCTEE